MQESWSFTGRDHAWLYAEDPYAEPGRIQSRVVAPAMCLASALVFVLAPFPGTPFGHRRTAQELQCVPKARSLISWALQGHPHGRNATFSEPCYLDRCDGSCAPGSQTPPWETPTKKWKRAEVGYKLCESFRFHAQHCMDPWATQMAVRSSSWVPN